MTTASKLTLTPNTGNLNLGFDSNTAAPAHSITVGLHSAANGGLGIAIKQVDGSYLLNFPVQANINGANLTYSSRFITNNNTLTLDKNISSDLNTKQTNATALVVVDLDLTHTVAIPIGNIVLLANKAVGDAIITLNNIPTVTQGQSFTVSGTLSNYPTGITSVSLVWAINNLGYVAAGAVTLNGGTGTFSFMHPGISPLISASVLCVMDSNGLIAISNSLS